MALTDLFPLKVLTKPDEAFRGLAGDGAGWARPLALYALAMAAAALLFTLLPPEYLADSFEGFRFSRDRGFAFYFAAAFGGGLGFTFFVSALVSALARFLGKGRLSLRLVGAAALTGGLGLLAAALHGAAGGARSFGAAASLAAAAGAGWAGFSDRKRFAALTRCLFAASALALAGDLCGGAAALAGSVRAYTASEYFFSVLALYWGTKAVSAVYGAPKARAAAAVALGALGGAAFLFLLRGAGLLPDGLFEALLLV